jgi:hypothetical protein
MIRVIGLWLVVCALCVTPVAADEDVYDGPTAIKPLIVTPKPQQSAPPNTVCDFEHQCYPEGRTPGQGTRGSSGRGRQAGRSSAHGPR